MRNYLDTELVSEAVWFITSDTTNVRSGIRVRGSLVVADDDHQAYDALVWIPLTSVKNKPTFYLSDPFGYVFQVVYPNGEVFTIDTRVSKYMPLERYDFVPKFNVEEAENYRRELYNKQSSSKEKKSLCNIFSKILILLKGLFSSVDSYNRTLPKYNKNERF